MTETPQEPNVVETEEGTEPGPTIPANEDVEPGTEPQPASERDDGAQDDGSDPVADDDREQEPVGEPDDDGS